VCPIVVSLHGDFQIRVQGAVVDAVVQIEIGVETLLEIRADVQSALILLDRADLAGELVHRRLPRLVVREELRKIPAVFDGYVFSGGVGIGFVGVRGKGQGEARREQEQEEGAHRGTSRVGGTAETRCRP
jgi:hypothetical protein